MTPPTNTQYRYYPDLNHIENLDSLIKSSLQILENGFLVILAEEETSKTHWLERLFIEGEL